MFSIPAKLIGLNSCKVFHPGLNSDVMSFKLSHYIAGIETIRLQTSREHTQFPGTVKESIICAQAQKGFLELCLYHDSVLQSGLLHGLFRNSEHWQKSLKFRTYSEHFAVKIFVSCLELL